MSSCRYKHFNLYKYFFLVKNKLNFGELAVSSKFKADLEKSFGNHIIYDGFKLVLHGTEDPRMGEVVSGGSAQL